MKPNEILSDYKNLTDSKFREKYNLIIFRKMRYYQHRDAQPGDIIEAKFYYSTPVMRYDRLSGLRSSTEDWSAIEKCLVLGKCDRNNVIHLVRLKNETE